MEKMRQEEVSGIAMVPLEAEEVKKEIDRFVEEYHIPVVTFTSDVEDTKRLCFVIGGPYGFSKEVYERADAKLSLSKMTFSHQIVRAIFAEQLYRAFTIIRNEPYHHE